MATTAADYNWAGTSVPGGDIGCINTDVSTITVGTVVIVDATNSLTTTAFSGFSGGLPAPGVKIAGADAYAFGVAIENIAVGAQGRVRRLGVAVCNATAAVVTAGDVIKVGAAGAVLTNTAVSAKAQLGQALNTTSGTAADPVLVALDIARNN